jgi:2-methylisocitrate lyase-like PEP mutase family enzyme
MTTRAAQFRSLHAGAPLLILPNAWDAGSARLFEKGGAKAIATTSAGMAWALGYTDGYKLPVEEFVRVTATIRRAITVPLSIDIENGYAGSPREVAELALRLIEAGADGINIEDGSDAPDVLAKKIEAIKSAITKRGQDLFINARTDVFLAGLVDAAKSVAETVAREGTYRAAGADGLFVPGLAKPDQIRAVVAAAKLPINVMAWKNLPVATELAALGIRRLSAGAALAQSAMTDAAMQCKKFLESGSSALFDGVMPYSIIQSLWSRA